MVKTAVITALVLFGLSTWLAGRYEELNLVYGLADHIRDYGDVTGFLKQVLQTTDGNLSVHARRLEEAGYVEIRKSYEGRIPRTDYRLTRTGRQALQRYLDHMEALIERVRE